MRVGSVLAEGLLLAADRLVGRAIGLYCRGAAQRRPLRLLEITGAPTAKRGTVVLLRCFSQVPYGERFKEVFLEAGHTVHEVEIRRRIIGTIETIAEVIESLIVHPPPGKIDIVVGASVGGAVDVVLGKLAKASPEARRLLISKLDFILPKTPHRTIPALHQLAERLSGAKYIPLNPLLFGEEFKPPVEVVIRWSDRLWRGLFGGFRRQFLEGVDPRSKEGLYQYLGFDLAEVVDGVVLGAAQTWGLHATDAASLAVNAAMQGLGRGVSKLVLRRAPGEICDGVIRGRAALKGIDPRRVRIVPNANHIDGMELPETAEAILELSRLPS